MKYKTLSSIIGLLMINSSFANEYLFKNQFNHLLDVQIDNNYSNFNQDKISNINDIKNIMDNYIAKNSFTTYVTGIPLLIQCNKYNKGKKVIINSGYQSEYGFPVNNHSLFQIGSNSKSFLSVVVLQLEAENKMSIENTVEDFFPNRYPKWNKITIKQLLNMTSGILDYANDDNTLLKEIGKNPFKLYSSDEILDLIKDKEVLFNPGTNWKYSNTNYVILGKIIEKITHHTVAYEIHKRIIKPLKLHHTFYVESFTKIDIPRNEEKNIMDGYFFSDEQFLPYLDNGKGIIDYTMSWGNSAGSITSNTEDLNKYFHALFERDFKGNTTLLSKIQFEKLVSLIDTTNGKPLINGVNKVNTNGYGLGIGAIYDSSINSRYYTHTGGTLGFTSLWIYNPEKNMSFVYSLNTANTDNFMQEVFQPTLSFLYKNCY